MEVEVVDEDVVLDKEDVARRRGVPESPGDGVDDDLAESEVGLLLPMLTKALEEIGDSVWVSH